MDSSSQLNQITSKEPHPYQNMQRTWRLLFVPATYATAIGIIGFAAGRIQPATTTAFISLAAVAAVVAITAWWGWRSRPVLGVQD
jgi:hypothetical protein